ncbi:MAG TPA: hypothetical protein ENN49_08775 [Bacteroidales bacterium]|nr:hypothetical protein [Bacteroidales bacterium]
MQLNKAEQFQKAIEASSDEAIIGLLAELRETGEDYMLPTILSLLFSARSEKLKNEVVNFLVDLKNKSSVDTIIETIKQNKRSKEIHLLVSVCWQSRLDFTPHVDTFIDIMEHANYQGCLEAFTVIENMTGNLSRDQLNELKAKIKTVKADNPETKPLIEELGKLLDEL